MTTKPLKRILDDLRVCEDVKEAQDLFDETLYIYGTDSLELETVGELYNYRINELMGVYDDN